MFKYKDNKVRGIHTNTKKKKEKKKNSKVTDFSIKYSEKNPLLQKAFA
jgi:hypothetical protein